MKTLLLSLFGTLIFSECALAFNNTNGTGTNDVTAVTLNNDQAFGVCVYPMSGQYDFLNRILYYTVLIFSLFSRAHLWLVTGSLAFALTYSGAAAIHACLLVWRGPNPYIENDSWALSLILTTACLMTVPLLNWSGTLRRLGARAASIKDSKGLVTNSSAGTRTIVIYWAFLVLVGYICIWEQYHFGEADLNKEYPDMNKVICQAGTNASMLMSPNGTFHPRAIDEQFILQNGCTNPCNQLDIPSIFRQKTDLVLLNHAQALLWNSELPGPKYEKLQKLNTAENGILSLSFFTLPFVLVQGFIAACFGRRDPREVRDLIYIKLFMDNPGSTKYGLRLLQDWSVRILAFLSYIIAVATIIVCPPLILILVVSQEWSDWVEIPSADALKNVGQWEPWAMAGLAIIAALIARYHDRMIRAIATRLWWLLRRMGVMQRKRPAASPDAKGGSISTSSLEHPPVTLASKEDPEQALKHEDQQPPQGAQIARGQTPASDVARRSLPQRLSRKFYQAYKAATRPINQNGEGIGDEVGNFFRWCKDPQAVSRRVIRHPIRPQDPDKMEYMLGPDGEPLPERPVFPQERKGSGFFRSATSKPEAMD